MSFLKKLFSGGSRGIEGVRKALEERRYADVEHLADRINIEKLSPSECDELWQFRLDAGDAMARMSLKEALGMRSRGKGQEAEDYFQLALEKVCSDALKSEITQAQSEGSAKASLAEMEEHSAQEDTVDLMPVDREEQLELILASYPEEIRQRYMDKDDAFKEAFLLAQQGEDKRSLEYWRRIDETRQDDLYCFEIGSLLARNGQHKEASRFFTAALEINPQLLLAVEALTALLVEEQQYDLALEMLEKLRSEGGDEYFCQAQLAIVYARSGKIDMAAGAVRRALAGGSVNVSFLIFSATVFERSGAVDEAADLLATLPANACRGGANVHLAELWLRHKRELKKALDSFNAACREEPQNPRWQLRVAQTYMALNWVKDGMKILKMVVDDPRLDDDLAQEARQLLDQGRV